MKLYLFATFPTFHPGKVSDQECVNEYNKYDQEVQKYENFALPLMGVAESCLALFSLVVVIETILGMVLIYTVTK